MVKMIPLVRLCKTDENGNNSSLGTGPRLEHLISSADDFGKISKGSNGYRIDIEIVKLVYQDKSKRQKVELTFGEYQKLGMPDKIDSKYIPLDQS